MGSPEYTPVDGLERMVVKKRSPQRLLAESWGDDPGSIDREPGIKKEVLSYFFFFFLVVFFLATFFFLVFFLAAMSPPQ
jgi:hypothetical protein